MISPWTSWQISQKCPTLFFYAVDTEWCICSTANPWEQVTIYTETDGEITIQYDYWSLVEAEQQKDPSCGAVAFSAYAAYRSSIFETKPILISWKIWTSSGNQNFLLIFLSQQWHLHFSTEPGLEQRVWLLSLLVKCLKKTCNLNCCRAHQYEIGLVEGNKM